MDFGLRFASAFIIFRHFGRHRLLSWLLLSVLTSVGSLLYFSNSLTFDNWCNFARFSENPVKCYSFSYSISPPFLKLRVICATLPLTPPIWNPIFRRELFPILSNWTVTICNTMKSIHPSIHAFIHPYGERGSGNLLRFYDRTIKRRRKTLWAGMLVSGTYRAICHVIYVKRG